MTPCLFVPSQKGLGIAARSFCIEYQLAASCVDHLLPFILERCKGDPLGEHIAEGHRRLCKVEFPLSVYPGSDVLFVLCNFVSPVSGLSFLLA